MYEGWWGDMRVAVKQMIRCTKNDKAKVSARTHARTHTYTLTYTRHVP